MDGLRQMYYQQRDENEALVAENKRQAEWRAGAERVLWAHEKADHTLPHELQNLRDSLLEDAATASPLFVAASALAERLNELDISLPELEKMLEVLVSIEGDAGIPASGERP